MPAFSLNALGLVDAPPEPAFDNITALASDVLGAAVSLVSIVEPERGRQFFKSQHGLPEPWASRRETPLSHSFCRHVVEGNRALVVDDARVHPLVHDNLAVVELGAMAYLGAPVHDPDGSPVGALCVVECRPRHWSEAEIVLLGRLATCVSDAVRLKVALVRAEALRHEHTEFTYALSHDLRAPFTTLEMLFGELSALPEPAPPAESRLLVGLGIRTIEHTRALIDEVSSYVCSTREGADAEPVELGALVIELGETTLRGDLVGTGAVLECGELPCVQGSPVQLRMLMQNLLENAIRYRREDRVPHVSVSGERVGRHACITVRDNGIGIAPEHHERVFGLFRRLHTRADRPGSGLGLTICRRIVANHGGSITLVSTPGEGAAFSIRLPLAA